MSHFRRILFLELCKKLLFNMYTEDQIIAFEKEHNPEGERETTVLTIGGKSAFFALDFSDIQKAYSRMVAPKMSGQGENMKLDMDLDMTSAGDILFKFGLKESEQGFKNPFRRLKAGQKLASWLMEQVGDSDEDEEKKS